MTLGTILSILEFTLIAFGFKYVIQPTNNLNGIMVKPQELWTVPYLLGWIALLGYVGPMIVIPWTFAKIFNFCVIVVIYYLMWDCMWTKNTTKTYRITLFGWAIVAIGFLIFRGMIV